MRSTGTITLVSFHLSVNVSPRLQTLRLRLDAVSFLLSHQSGACILGRDAPLISSITTLFVSLDSIKREKCPGPAPTSRIDL
jgi:hypothetical protein